MDKNEPKPLASRTGQFRAFSMTPPFFQTTAIRKGKWTTEEENYASFMITHFEKGTLKQCENGLTLRAFLSRKLHCAPMRISKKYAGKSIGKLVYLSKADATEETLVAVDKELRDLEAKFYKSLYEEMHPARHSTFRYPMTTSLMPPLMQPMSMMNHHHAMGMASGGLHPPMASHQLPFGVGPIQHLPQQVVMQPTAGIPMQPNAVPPSTVHTNNLHQSYMNALSQMMKTNNGQGGTIAVANPQVPATATPQVSTVPCAAPSPAPSRPKAVQKTTKEPTAAATSTLQQKPQSPSVPGVKSVPSSEVPDFLSGFENVSGGEERQRPQWTMPGGPLLVGAFECNGVPLQCSPPLTSKSFDDLHRLLGSDLSPNPLDLNNSKTEQPTTAERQAASSKFAAAMHTTNTFTNQNDTVTMTNISADVYASFAQQSALAVSQHSAYCRTDKVSDQTSGFHYTAPVSAPDISSSLAAMYGKPKTQTSFPSTNARIVSGSERSSDGEGGSMHGSTSSSNTGTSDTTSNDSDSASEEGPPRKKTKTGEENAREVALPVTADRSSPQAQ